MIHTPNIPEYMIRLKDGIIVPTGAVGIYLFDAKTGNLKDMQIVKNMFLTAGMNSIAARLIQQDKGKITYCAVGTNTTSPARSDTQLGTELYRKLISVSTVSGKVATFQTYYGITEANGVLKEAGLFGDDATATANSGTMFTHTNINRTKTSAETLLLSWAVTIGG